MSISPARLRPTSRSSPCGRCVELTAELGASAVAVPLDPAVAVPLSPAVAVPLYPAVAVPQVPTTLMVVCVCASAGASQSSERAAEMTARKRFMTISP
jgi:cytochrome c-type biogenesis protein CcmH/NrfG